MNKVLVPGLIAILLLLFSCEEIPTNQSPIADAGNDEYIYPGASITLDGSMSFDPEGNNLRYEWTLISRPLASKTITFPENEAIVEAILTEVGDYVFELAVYDGSGKGTDKVTITVQDYKGLQSFSFLTANNPDLKFDCVGVISEGRVDLTVPGIMDLTNLTADFSFTGESLKIEAELQQSGVTGNDYTSPVIFTLKSTDGDRSNFTVYVEKNYIPVIPEMETSYIEPGGNFILDASGSSDRENKELTYQWSVISQPEESALADFPSSESSVIVTPEYTGNYIFEVSVSDGFQTAVKEITHVLQKAKALQEFKFTSAANPDLESDITGIIDQENHIVTIYYPHNKSTENLIAEFTYTGKSISIGEGEQISGTSSNNFSSSVNYTITSDDGQTLDYTINLISTYINSISLTAHPSETITLSMDDGTDFHSGDTITVQINESGFANWEWYLDGTKQTTVTNIFSISAGDAGGGMHRLTVNAEKNGHYYSASLSFKVINNSSAGGEGGNICV